MDWRPPAAPDGGRAIEDWERLVTDGAILADVLKATSMPVAILDPHQPDHPMVFVNDAFCALTGQDPAGLLGRGLDVLLAPDSGAAARARLRDAVAAGTPASIALTAARRDGSRLRTRLVLAPAPGEDGRPRHVIAALLYGAGYSMVFTLLNTEVLETVAAPRRGAAFGTFMFAFDAGIGLGSYALGLLMGRYGFQWGWRTGVVAMICALPITLRIARRQRS